MLEIIKSMQKIESNLQQIHTRTTLFKSYIQDKKFSIWWDTLV
jgi:hypothetical protein